MAPTDKMRAPFRWEFAPRESPLDKSIHWIWRAYGQSGALVMESDGAFETREECVLDAESRGFEAVD